MKKLLFVVNPKAGTRKANKVLPEIISVFNQAGYETSVHITSGQGDAQQAVKKFAKGKNMVVCCGGDGTFNETVAGIMEGELNIPVGYIPAGSTNDFANSLGLQTNPLEAAKDIVSGKTVRYDIGSFAGRYFTYVASFGIFTKTSYSTPQNVKNALGHTAYLLEGIQELSQLRNKFHLKLELDGEILEGDYIFGAICNSTSVGGILTLDPKRVDMQDGLFEVLLVRYPKDLGEVAECISAVQKQSYNSKMMTFRSSSRIRITADPGMDWTLDGERERGRKNITVENLHQALKLVCRERV